MEHREAASVYVCEFVTDCAVACCVRWRMGVEKRWSEWESSTLGEIPFRACKLCRRRCTSDVFDLLRLRGEGRGKAGA